MAAMTRDDLIQILAETVQAVRSRLSDTRLADGLKAAELLTKLCGWNEPEKREERHLHAHVVDRAMLEQLRKGFMELQGASARMKLAQSARDPCHPRTASSPRGNKWQTNENQNTQGSVELHL